MSGHAPACCQATLGLTSQYSWSHSFNANVGVTAQVVTAGIGFDVTLTGSNSYQYSLNMPPNTTWEIDAYHKHAVTDYDVWFDPWIGDSYKAGSGQAFEFKGVSYSIWQVA
ncbi:hypothetical protein F8S13_13335 [Chloroflexia bacterium SDU3-3]|nr:hypothetical protein F8S13_13335 [Chloroflexia bacterium SDU3-3]